MYALDMTYCRHCPRTHTIFKQSHYQSHIVHFCEKQQISIRFSCGFFPQQRLFSRTQTQVKTSPATSRSLKTCPSSEPGVVHCGRKLELARCPPVSHFRSCAPLDLLKRSSEMKSCDYWLESDEPRFLTVFLQQSSGHQQLQVQTWRPVRKQSGRSSLQFAVWNSSRSRNCHWSSSSSRTMV